MPPKRKPRANSVKSTANNGESTGIPSKRLKTEPTATVTLSTAETSANGKQPDVKSESDKAKTSVPKPVPNGKGTTSLKIVSWNVNGSRGLLKKEDALEYLRTVKCDILCLQETKCSKKNFPTELSGQERFPHKYYAFSDKEGYAGVALFSRLKPFSVQYGLGDAKHDTEGRVITAFYENFILVNTYTPNAGQGLVRLSYRMGWDKDFREYLSKLDAIKPVILCGDLNVAHKEIDIENPKSNVKNAGFTPEERAGFTALLDAGFVDSFRHLNPSKTKAYTFWSYRSGARAKNVGWRLDYFVISSRLCHDALGDSQIHSEVMGSDHCPLSLDITL